jgi:hypothetical protein
MSTILLRLTKDEASALVDALTKGASRHESYAKFKPYSSKASTHEKSASLMRRIRRYVEAEAELV